MNFFNLWALRGFSGFTWQSAQTHPVLHKCFFFIFVEGCAVLGLSKLASSSITRLPPRDVTALGTY